MENVRCLKTKVQFMWLYHKYSLKRALSQYNESLKLQNVPLSGFWWMEQGHALIPETYKDPDKRAWTNRP